MPKSLKKETREKVVVWLTRYRDENFPPEERDHGWQRKAATALRTSPATISRLMGDVPQGGSQEIIEALAEAFDVSPSEIMYGEKEDATMPRMRSHPEFPAALEEAQKQAKRNRMHIPAAAWRKAGDIYVRPLPRPTPDLLLHLAIAYAQSTDAPRQ
jgi:transcriptional regulator with XRE-family HTH domain